VPMNDYVVVALLGDWAECKTSHEEAERELCRSRGDVQGMSDRPESGESHVDRDQGKRGKGSEKRARRDFLGH
jgi:hypothetical protein